MFSTEFEMATEQVRTIKLKARDVFRKELGVLRDYEVEITSHGIASSLMQTRF